MKIRCPVCKRKFDPLQIKKWLPFCSERCQLIDLGDWLNESHKITSHAEEPVSSPEEYDSKKH